MVEHKSDRLLLCKLCPKETTNSIYIANCVECKNLFCFDHLIQHRRQLPNEIEQLIKRHIDINEKSLTQLNINQHLEFIDQWEHEAVEFIRKETECVKNKILSIFNTYTSQLKQYHTILGKELNEKRDPNRCIERDFIQLSKRMEQLDKEIQHVNIVLYQLSLNELNQIINKYNLSTKTIEKSTRWNYLFEIKLDSTYGYMAANDQQIFLGWKNRIAIYNLNGTKHDETRLQSIEIYGELCDIIWSSIMQRFFILCRKSLFVHYPAHKQIEFLSKISLINQTNQYISLTTYKNHLFLLNEKSLDRWILNNEIYLLEHSILTSLIIKNSLEENICCIRANEENLAILIQNNKTYTWHLDLFHFVSFQRIHIGLSFDCFNQPYLGLIMTLDSNIYLFMNWETKFMRIIDQNGSSQIIDYNAYNACLLGNQRRLVVNYMTHLKIYEI